MLKKVNWYNNLISSFLISILFSSNVIASDKHILKAYIGTDKSKSFWLLNNNGGIDLNEHTINLFIFEEKDKISYKINTFFQQNRNILGESFIKIDFDRSSFIRLGQYYRDYSLYLNDRISLGHMLISNNALPMKKVGYVSKTDVNKFLNFQYGISHGVFDKNTLYTKAPLLHEKFIYLNYSKNRYLFSVGLVHEAIWGGEINNEGQQPSSLKDFFKVIIAADEPKKDGQPHANAIGNHLGIWDFSYQVKINSNKIKMYHQHFFEDTSGLRFANGIDGLWGVEFIDNNNEKNILLEYLHTTNQNSDPPYVNEAYYNHSLYKMGWSFKDKTIGNPYINSKKIVPVNVVNIGFSNNSKNYYYEFKSSRITNTEDYWNYMVSIKKKINKTIIGLMMTNTFDNSTGFIINIEI
tara:strand:- start:5790 stop:7016 length:1227 start_codon:yes stop_codon:yes gene_type:complete